MAYTLHLKYKKISHEGKNILTGNNDYHYIKGPIHQENIIILHFMYLINLASKYIMGKNWKEFHEKNWQMPPSK